MAKEKRALAAFQRQQEALCCPVCGSSGQMTAQGCFICDQGHSFDLAAKGYLNLLTQSGKRKNLYDKELFAARGRIFAAGFYEPVRQAVEDAIQRYAPKREKRLTILDAGCGEGYYAAALAAKYDVFALDNVKEAIQQAASRSSQVRWLVANLSSIPLADHTLDVVLDILTPANYQEFQRLLAPGGVLLKIIPGCHYLKEIREQVAGQLSAKDYSNEETLSCFEAHMAPMAVVPIQYTKLLNREEARDFCRMTPLTFHVDTAALPLANLEKITIDLLLLLGSVPNKDEDNKNRR